MARMEVSGCDALISGLEDMLKSAPQIRDAILDAEADVIEPAVRKSILDERVYRSGNLYRSIARKKGKLAGIPVIRIGPEGEHHRYLPSSGKSGIVVSGYVGYIHEYGVPSRGIKARRFLEKAVEKSKSQAYSAAEAVYDKYMKNNNL